MIKFKADSAFNKVKQSIIYLQQLRFTININIIMDKLVCIEDFRNNASVKLKSQIFTYIDSGSDNQQTRFANEHAFRKIILMPKVLISNDKVNMQKQILGRIMSLPFGFAPSAMHMISHPEGEVIPARVCKEKNICYTQSILSTRSFADISQANGDGLRLLQLYVSNDWQKTINTIKLAEKYGFTGIVITVDAQVLGVRTRQNRFPMDLSKYNFPILDQLSSKNITERISYLKHRDLKMNWQTIQKIRMLTKLKIVLKGIMHPEDAKIAKNYCDAIWVSNHGGRQLDGVLATIDTLPQIRAVVGNEMQVYVDGGIKAGTDIFKCLALGASYVFLGRAVLFSLVEGEQGVLKMVNILQDELRRTMILMGVTKLSEIKANSLKYQANL